MSEAEIQEIYEEILRRHPSVTDPPRELIHRCMGIRPSRHYPLDELMEVQGNGTVVPAEEDGPGANLYDPPQVDPFYRKLGPLDRAELEETTADLREEFRPDRTISVPPRMDRGASFEWDVDVLGGAIIETRRSLLQMQQAALQATIGVVALQKAMSSIFRAAPDRVVRGCEPIGGVSDE